jgi:predicted FMN-binding regulatory protein PaiB
MAPSKGKTKTTSVTVRLAKPKVSRKGIHAKTKMSKNKNSKNYTKVSRGQG